MQSTRKGQTVSPSQRAQLALPPQPKIGPRNWRKNRVAGGVRSRLTLGLASREMKLVDKGLLLLPRHLCAVALSFPPHLLPSPHRGICSSLRRRGTPAVATLIAFPGGFLPGEQEQAGVGGAKWGRNSKKRNSPAGSHRSKSGGRERRRGVEEGNPRRHATGTER
jgi:hypothetical protein